MTEMFDRQNIAIHKSSQTNITFMSYTNKHLSWHQESYDRAHNQRQLFNAILLHKPTFSINYMNCIDGQLIQFRGNIPRVNGGS